MTVKELIEKLQQFDEKLEVHAYIDVLDDFQGYLSIENAYISEHDLNIVTLETY